MPKLIKFSAWVQQNYDTCLLFSLCIFPLGLLTLDASWSARLLMAYLALVSGFILHAKVMRKRPNRVPATERHWFFVFVSASAGVVLSWVWPDLACPTLFWIMPLTLWVLGRERHHRYRIVRRRIQQRRLQQSRWREAKRAVLSEWKERLRWLAGVQHDMRQPLHALGLLVGHPALGDKGSPGSSRLVIQQMVSCQRWLHDLAENMLEATRLELGEQREQRIETVMTTELCESMVSWMEQLAESKGLRFMLDIQEIQIHTDVRRLKRVLGNLVFNAVEHTLEGEVKLTYKPHGGVHRFTVSDTGPGLVDSWLMQKSVGRSSFGSDLPKSGIGLYVVKKLCQEMEWNLSVCSTPGQGTSFVLELADRLDSTRANRKPNTSHTEPSKRGPKDNHASPVTPKVR